MPSLNRRPQNKEFLTQTARSHRRAAKRQNRAGDQPGRRLGVPGKDARQSHEWIPATGDHAALDLFILIDDSASENLGTQLNDIKKLIESQPDTTKVGVAYMQNGIARVVQNLTTDHAAASKSVRLPMGIGGANASPYFSLSDLVKRWPDDGAPRRAVMMITDGIDRYYGEFNLQDPYSGCGRRRRLARPRYGFRHFSTNRNRRSLWPQLIRRAIPASHLTMLPTRPEEKLTT